MKREEFINWFEGFTLLTPNDIYDLGQLYDEVTKPQWISVEDELPKENGWYLVCNNIHDYGHCLYEIAEYYARFRSWIWAHTVTHWMPLPQPPKGGKQ